MIQEAGPGAAPFLADGELQETLGPQAIVVLGRMRRVAVVLGRSGGEVSGELQATVLQLPLVLRQAEIHQPRASA